MSKPSQPASVAVRAGIESDTQFGAVVPPIYLSANFTFEAFDRRRAHDYTRSGNPTRDLLASALADLEGGAGAVITSSGMSAITLVLQLLRPGDRLVAPHDAYGGTWRALQALAEKGNFELRLVDLTDKDNLGEVATWGPRMVWVETPSNPLLRLTDLEAVRKVADHCGALLVADNTFLSPLLQKPFDFGADIVVHSTTKYINGHSDVVGGAVVCAEEALLEECAWWANCLGVTGSPFDSYLTMRGLRTLHARMTAHDRSAREVVSFVDGHPAVLRTYHPSLIDHPGHSVAGKEHDHEVILANGVGIRDPLLQGHEEVVSRRVLVLEDAHTVPREAEALDQNFGKAPGIGNGIAQIRIRRVLVAVDPDDESMAVAVSGEV